MLLGNGFGALLVLSAGLLLWAAAVKGSAGYIVGASGCIAVWLATSMTSLRLCRRGIVVRKLFSRNIEYVFADIALIEVGKIREGHGYSGYSGFAMVIELSSGKRITIEPSRHSGRSRLAGWAEAIAAHGGFTGTLRTTTDVIRGGST